MNVSDHKDNDESSFDNVSSVSTSSATDDNVYCIVLVLRVPVLLLLLTIQIL